MSPCATTSTIFQGSTVSVARRLLGSLLVHESPEGTTVGRIIETEAYLRNDPACHAFRGKTPRTEMMFGEAGRSYVYFIYGMYYCFNVVTNKPGIGEAVLVRAVEPLEGIDLMRERRGKDRVQDLCSGPGKLTAAFGIDSAQNGLCLTKSSLRILPGARRTKSEKVIITPRIGISVAKDLELRFLLERAKESRRR